MPRRGVCHLSCHRTGAIADWNESLILFLLGRYAEGWRKYEGRWGIADHDPPRPDARVPNLSDVAGTRVLLTAEQGHGDMIQFVRYAPLLSVPLVFGTLVDTIPARAPYLAPPVERVTAWHRRLGARGRPRIGLCWWGSQHILKRSVPIETLSPLLSCPGIELHALQKEIPALQRAWLSAHDGLIDHSAALNDYADTTALISQLDLVVTIDTSVAHLAGALGKPVWIMLQHSADWRWLLDRDDSPWYPTARLFRQHRAGDWQTVVSDVAAELSAWLAAGHRPTA